jgi:hypothetical protein
VDLFTLADRQGHAADFADAYSHSKLCQVGPPLGCGRGDPLPTSWPAVFCQQPPSPSSSWSSTATWRPLALLTPPFAPTSPPTNHRSDCPSSSQAAAERVEQLQQDGHLVPAAMAGELSVTQSTNTPWWWGLRTLVKVRGRPQWLEGVLCRLRPACISFLLIKHVHPWTRSMHSAEPPSPGSPCSCPARLPHC